VYSTGFLVLGHKSKGEYEGGEFSFRYFLSPKDLSFSPSTSFPFLPDYFPSLVKEDLLALFRLGLSL